ncbi:hypothetical protein UFOVP4_30 [uncultured Caudovirales phage]|uniref:Uncharacterized protein n=1 Tax=uncultured Caudovirales phage TaxID=2100421 RepID=A0A6J7VKR3_9CAUD|nr:hypothetical protein UFOVP4_30 [uncultured Caudovirales phage]CAB4241282.1 hypothetical protein UFOVP64_30 [uncultured Caudovirales phage]CAB5079003.1 hypothetical protein UFOVP145_44 [uncultured Caudovirales phage]
MIIDQHRIIDRHHQRLLDGPNANRHLAIVYPEVAEHRPASVRIARIALEGLALATIVAATIVAFSI